MAYLYGSTYPKLTCIIPKYYYLYSLLEYSRNNPVCFMLFFRFLFEHIDNTPKSFVTPFDNTQNNNFVNWITDYVIFNNILDYDKVYVYRISSSA